MEKSPTSITANILNDPQVKESLDNSFSWAANDGSKTEPSAASGNDSFASLMQRWNGEEKQPSKSSNSSKSVPKKKRSSKGGVLLSSSSSSSSPMVSPQRSWKRLSHEGSEAMPAALAAAQLSLHDDDISKSSKQKQKQKHSGSSATSTSTSTTTSRSTTKFHSKTKRSSKSDTSLLSASTSAADTTVKHKHQTATSNKEKKQEELVRERLKKKQALELEQEEEHQKRLAKLRKRINNTNKKLQQLDIQRALQSKEDATRLKQEQHEYRQDIARKHYPELSSNSNPNRNKLVQETSELISYLRKDNEALRTRTPKQLRELERSNAALERTRLSMKQSYEQLQQHVGSLTDSQSRLSRRSAAFKNKLHEYQRELRSRERYQQLEEHLGLRYETTILQIGRRIEQRTGSATTPRRRSHANIPPMPTTMSPFTPTNRKTKEQRRRAQQLFHWLVSAIADGEEEANLQRSSIVQGAARFAISDALRDGTPISSGCILQKYYHNNNQHHDDDSSDSDDDE